MNSEVGKYIHLRIAAGSINLVGSCKTLTDLRVGFDRNGCEELIWQVVPHNLKRVERDAVPSVPHAKSDNSFTNTDCV